MEKVKVLSGTYRGKTIKNKSFQVIKPLTKGKNGYYITVKPTSTIGKGKSRIRINVTAKGIKYLDPNTNSSVMKETDTQIMNRIAERFDILEEMTKASINTDVKAMIVSGPPGVGKSYGVEKELNKANLFDDIANKTPKYEVIKGAMTPIGLYSTLFRHSRHGHVLVFDDCDAVLQDDLSLNILKAALDSGKRRRVYWNADSHLLRREGIPSSFDFEASVIFITNMKFDNIRSKKLKDHLLALQSRCHYLDLTLDTMREKFLRVKNISESGELFKNYNYTSEDAKEIIDFMDQNKEVLNEMSLRMALKIADLRKISPARWKFLAMNTCMKHDC